nr:MAG TPA: hypothetical protein [Caudoviricetes sp.]
MQLKHKHRFSPSSVAKLPFLFVTLVGFCI